MAAADYAVLQYYRVELRRSQDLLAEAGEQLYKSTEIISDETWEMAESVDLNIWERMVPGYLDFYSQIELYLQNIQRELAEVKEDINIKNWSGFSRTYQSNRDKITACFFRFEKGNEDFFRKTSEEISLHSWSDYIASIFLTDSTLTKLTRPLSRVSPIAFEFLKNHMAGLEYQIKLQIVSLGCQREYFSKVLPQIIFPPLDIIQDEPYEVWINMVYQLENLNPRFNQLAVNGDTLSEAEFRQGTFTLPTGQSGQQEIMISYFGLDPIMGHPEESTVIYSYEVLESE